MWVKGLLMLLAAASSAMARNVSAFDAADNLLANQDFHSKASYYIVGDKTKKRLIVWHPYNFPNGGDVGKIFVRVAHDFLNSTRVNNTDQYYVHIKSMGWGDVVNKDVCMNPGSLDCPDVIGLGTTGLGFRVRRKELHPLDSYFGQYAIENGAVITDDFIRQQYYDLYAEGAWYGFPWVLDTRLIMFNRTVFDQLNLTYPPPLGEWEPGTWTWKKLAEYAKIITDAGKYGYGFKVWGGSDEEMKLFNLIAREYKTTLLNMDSNTCGYRNDRFKTMLNEVVFKMWKEDKSANPDINNISYSGFNTWVQQPLAASVEKNPIFCCSYPKFTFETMTFVSTPEVAKYEKLGMIYDYRRISNATVGIAYVPGSSFLGGSLMTMTAKSQYKDAAWKFILTTKKSEYTSSFATAVSNTPPFLSVLSSSAVWSGDQYRLIQEQNLKSFPIQYPRSTFHQLGELQGAKPVRGMLMEIIFKNITADEAVQRVSDSIDKIMMPVCDETYQNYTVSECDPLSMRRTVTYQWRSPLTCKITAASANLTADITIPCEYTPSDSRMATAMSALAYIGIAVTVGCGIVLFIYRNRPSVKRASISFSLVTLLGGILCFLSIPFMSGKPARCGVDAWLLSMGFAILVGSNTVKLIRIHRIFVGQLETKMSSLSDKTLFAYLGGILAFQIIVMALWQTVDVPFVNSALLTLPGSTVQYPSLTCATQKSVMSIILLFSNAMLVMYTCYLSVAIRKAPSMFNESRTLSIMVFCIAFVLVIVLPMSYLIEGAQAKYLVTSVGVLFATFTCVIVFTLIKYLERNKNEKITTYSNPDSKQAASVKNKDSAQSAHSTEMKMATQVNSSVASKSMSE